MNKRLALITVLLFGLGVVLASCAGMQVKPTARISRLRKSPLEGIDGAPV